MRKLRPISWLALATIIILGAICTFAASREWWVLSLASLFLAMIVIALLILVGVRHTLRQLLTLQQHLNQDRRRRTKWQEAFHEDRSEDAKTLQKKLKRLLDGQIEAQIVLESRITNVETRLQKVLDDKDRKFTR